MPLISTRGAASAQGFGEFAQSAAVNYIEDVFSTYLYTGNGSTQTITNGIDLSGKGGLVWMKGRSGATSHFLFDTARGALNEINSNNTDAQDSLADSLTAFNTSGFALGGAAGVNTNAATYVAWTFREQAKFFDVVTYTGDGVSGRAISHNLGSTPGCVIVKRTNSTGSWWVWHVSAGDNNNLRLNASDAALSGNTDYVRSATSTTFSVGPEVNGSGGSYVAYIFANNSGGFGLTGTDNVISCGSFTTDGSGDATVSLGYEPQWLLLKRTDAAEIWQLYDNMRGLTYASTGDARLIPNLANAEFLVNCANLTATGFVVQAGFELAPDATYIYIAIRRGPMKVPTSGTSVFTPLINQPVSGIFQSNILTDQVWVNTKTSSSVGRTWIYDRLRGNNRILTTRGNNIQASGTDAEGTYNASTSAFQQQTGFAGDAGFTNTDYNGWFFRRAPGFMDVVCYTGTGSNRTVAHNLSVVPELIFVKGRSQAGTYWVVRNASLASGNILYLSLDYASTENSNVFTTTAPTASVFSVGTNDSSNASGQTLVAYLFATLAGVSKVGSYTGSGTTKQIDCGFTGGARFVLIKRTDSTGDWYVYDSARGIVAGNDPYLLLNSTAAEVASTDYVDTYSAGFELSSTAPAGLNANGGTYIFLAIA